MFLLSILACASAETPTYMGRPIAQTMGVGGAEWLTRSTREVEERASRLITALDVKKGSVVCDVGAGNGYYSLMLATEVGRRGRVIATDIQPGMLARLKARAAEAKVGNIESVLSELEDARLPPDTCDVVLMVDVYHEFSAPEAMLKGIRASLTETGRVALVEYRKEDPKVPMKPLHKMTAAQCDLEFEANGFTRVGRYDGLPWQHVLFYGRAK